MNDIFCCVCREDNDVILICKHNLCNECFRKIKRIECPLCRKNIILDMVTRFKKDFENDTHIINNPLINYNELDYNDDFYDSVSEDSSSSEDNNIDNNPGNNIFAKTFLIYLKDIVKPLYPNENISTYKKFKLRIIRLYQFCALFPLLLLSSSQTTSKNRTYKMIYYILFICFMLFLIYISYKHYFKTTMLMLIIFISFIIFCLFMLYGDRESIYLSLPIVLRS